MSQDAAVCQLNENARRLLKDFHRLHLSVRGSDYSISFDKDVELVLGLDFPSFKQGAERLVERGLAQRVGHDSYRLTADGVRTAEDERRLDAHLPLRDPETLRQELDVQAEVWRQNGLARNLLALLHEWSLKAAGRPFFVTPNPETFGRTGLNDETYMQAASRLIAKHLATWAGPPRYVTITDAGIRVAEDEGALRSELPVGPVSAGISGSARSERKIIPMPDKKKVFVIHGRCEPARHEMGVFLRSLGLEPVWFRDVRKNMGGTAHVIKVVERGMAEAHGVLALVTPDEFSVLRPSMRKPGESGEIVERWQARPNVLFEAGMAYMRDPDRVAFVLFGEVKLFTDTSGMCLFWPNNDHGPDSYRAQLRDLLGGGMQCAINDKHDWMTSGDFNTVISGLSGVSPLDPFRAAS